VTSFTINPRSPRAEMWNCCPATRFPPC
jgi:hypothetical protein